MIPVSEPLLAGSEAKYVEDCIRSGWVSSEGKYLAAFEQAWAKYCGAEFGVAVSNGTTALQIAVAALDLEPGSEIILPSFTITIRRPGRSISIRSRPRSQARPARSCPCTCSVIPSICRV